MAPAWARVWVFAVFATSSADEAVVGDQECEIEVSLLQVDTQFKKARTHMESAEHGEVEVEIDSTVLMQTEAEVTEASSSATKSAKSKYASFAAGSSLLAPRAQEVKAYFQHRAEQKKKSGCRSSTVSVRPSRLGQLGIIGLDLCTKRAGQ